MKPSSVGSSSRSGFRNADIFSVAIDKSGAYAMLLFITEHQGEALPSQRGVTVQPGGITSGGKRGSTSHADFDLVAEALCEDRGELVPRDISRGQG